MPVYCICACWTPGRRRDGSMKLGSVHLFRRAVCPDVFLELYHQVSLLETLIILCVTAIFLGKTSFAQIFAKIEFL